MGSTKESGGAKSVTLVGMCWMSERGIYDCRTYGLDSRGCLVVHFKTVDLYGLSRVSNEFLFRCKWPPLWSG